VSPSAPWSFPVRVRLWTSRPPPSNSAALGTTPPIIDSIRRSRPASSLRQRPVVHPGVCHQRIRRGQRGSACSAGRILDQHWMAMKFWQPNFGPQNWYTNEVYGYRPPVRSGRMERHEVGGGRNATGSRFRVIGGGRCLGYPFNFAWTQWAPPPEPMPPTSFLN
jgi:hypothetical protein